MIDLKKANLEDWEKEFAFYVQLPSYENGFTNVDYDVPKDQFLRNVLPKLIDYDKGIGLPAGYVPETSYFLWDEQEIVGLFRLRHTLNDFLKRDAGHVGYSIAKTQRGKGYASAGLAMLINIARSVVPEEELYLSVWKSNPASLRVQMKNGAYIHHDDSYKYYTRIKL